MDANTHADSDSNLHTDVDAGATYAHADADGHVSATYADGHAGATTHTDKHTYVNQYADQDADANEDTHEDAQANGDATPLDSNRQWTVTLPSTPDSQGDTTMDIPVKAKVNCADGPCGESVYVIINPVSKRVTHLVVGEKGFPYMQYLVPVDLIVESTPHVIHLRCTRDELAALEPFIETEYIQGDNAYYIYVPEEYRVWPYVIPETLMPMEHMHIPPGELAVRRGTRVQATDGHVGRVDEFLVDPTNGHTTHLVLREGHLWGQKEVTIPVSQIDHIEEDTVYLKLDRHRIEALPAIPIRRR